MNKVREALPSVVGGVSQQPEALRRPDQGAEQHNALASTVEGLVKRPPLEFLRGASLPIGGGEPFIHSYKRGAERRYVAVIEAGSVRVVDLAERTVSVAEIAPAALPYFTDLGGRTAADAFYAMTVQDTTFLANKNVRCAVVESSPAPAVPDAIVYWRGSGYGERFVLNVGTKSYVIRVNDPPASGVPPQDVLKTNTIADAFAALLTGGSVSNTGLTVVSNPGPLGAGFTVNHEGSRIRIRGTAGTDFALSAEDGQNGGYIVAVKDTAQRLSDLPARGFDGFRIRVSGNAVTPLDDYWVVWDGTAWTETVNPAAADTINAATMPHILRPKEGGGWEVVPYTWKGRGCGDLLTNPSPSFVGETINSLTFDRDRLGIVTPNSVCLSAAGDYGAFYRSTVTSVLATDPIDLAYGNTAHHAFPFDRQILVFGDDTQSVVSSSEGPMSPATVAVTDVTRFSYDPGVAPERAGRVVFFASSNSGFTRINRFYPLAEKAGGYDAYDTTVDVPRFVPSGLRRIASSESDRIAVAVQRGAASRTAWIYQWLEDGERLVQSAWHSWDAPAPILDAFFFGPVLHLCVVKDGTMHILACDMTPNRSDDGIPYLVHLDWRMSETDFVSRTYDATEDTTRIVLPVALDASRLVVIDRGGGEDDGIVFDPISVSGAEIVLDGDLRSVPMFVGLSYEMRYRFSEFLVRDNNGSKRPVERVSVANIDLTLGPSGDFDVDINMPGRIPRRWRFSSYLLGSDATATGVAVLRSGSVRVPVRSRSDRVSITVSSTTPFPVRILGAAWNGSFADKHAAR